MNAKFNVFSQTMWLITVVPHVVLVKTSVKQVVYNSKTKWCKFTPKMVQPPAKHENIQQRTTTIRINKLQLLKTRNKNWGNGEFWIKCAKREKTGIMKKWWGGGATVAGGGMWWPVSECGWWLVVGESVENAVNVGAYGEGCWNVHCAGESDGEMGKQWPKIGHMALCHECTWLHIKCDRSYSCMIVCVWVDALVHLRSYDENCDWSQFT